MLMQCGMREESMGTIELGDMQGPVLEVLMEYLYGCLTEVPAQLLLPLFVAADAHQVSDTTRQSSIHAAAAHHATLQLMVGCMKCTSTAWQFYALYLHL